MYFKLKVKPLIYTASTKDEIINTIRGSRSLTISSYGTYYSTLSPRFHGRESVRVYSLQKDNAKYEQIKHKTGDRKGQTKCSVKIKHKMWTAFVYDFDVMLLKLLRVKVVQGERTFKIVKLENK